MSRPAVEVADILRAQGNRFLDRHEKSFDFQQLKAFRAIQRCRTAALGGHIDACPRCGYQAAISYNSCRNRHAQSARPSFVNGGWQLENGNYWPPATFMSSS